MNVADYNCIPTPKNEQQTYRRVFKKCFLGILLEVKHNVCVL